MIDTHCHLTYDGLHDRAEAVVAAALAQGVTRMISVGTTPSDTRKALELAERLPPIRVAAGLHPHYCADFTDRSATLDAMRPLVQLPEVAAMGEMGLDRHYPQPPIETQKRVFGWMLELMREHDKPAIIHNREATDETLAMIRDSAVPAERFVFHCFTGSDAELDAILELGAMVSFTGVVTFKNSAALAASATRVPLERIMVETDAPFLTPEPYRRVKTNEPRYVMEVGRFLAGKKGLSVEEFERRTDANAARFFRL